MVLVSFKNIDNWPSNSQKQHACPFLGIHFLAITQPLLGQLGWKFFGSSGDHQLSISYEKSKLRSLIFHFLIFRAPFGLLANIYNIIVKITGCQAWMLLNCFGRMLPGSCNSCEQDDANRDAACFCDAVPRPTKHKLRTSKLIFSNQFHK